MTYTTTANVEPKSREITTDIEVFQNTILDESKFKEFMNKVNYKDKNVPQSSTSKEGEMHFMTSDGTSKEITLNIKNETFNATAPNYGPLKSGNINEQVSFSKTHFESGISDGIKTSSSFNTYFSSVGFVKSEKDSSDEKSYIFYYKFTLKEDYSVITPTTGTDISTITNEFSIKVQLEGNQVSWVD